jgi:hypothetical protein
MPSAYFGFAAESERFPLGPALFPIGLCGRCGVASMRFSAASRRDTVSRSLYR